MISELTNLLIDKCKSRYAVYYLFGNGFLDVFFPWFPPTEILLLPICTEQPQRWVYMCSIALLGVCIGGSIVYSLGAFFAEDIATLLSSTPSITYDRDEVKEYLEKWGLISIFILAILPIPILVTSFVSGTQDINYFIFILALMSARGLRFYPFAFVVSTFNIQLDKFLRKHFFLFIILSSLIFFAILILIKTYF